MNTSNYPHPKQQPIPSQTEQTEQPTPPSQSAPTPTHVPPARLRTRSEALRKFTPETVSEMRRSYSEGLSIGQVAYEFRCSAITARKVIAGLGAYSTI